MTLHGIGAYRGGRMWALPALHPPGPAQSEDLIHFTQRPCGRPPTETVPQNIRDMSAQQRLDAILAGGQLWAFPPFGANGCATISFSEAPEPHLIHLIEDHGFPPWGLVFGRSSILGAGGGAVAYLPQHVRERFPEELRHWVVPFGTNGRFEDWSHEREWRLPVPGSQGFPLEGSLRAVLIGDITWRPTRVSTGNWWNPEDGSLESEFRDPPWQEETELPELWRTAEIWCWNRHTRSIDRHPPGTPDHTTLVTSWWGEWS
ncbi:hypothetical protein FNQ90_14210 [Streptomyces alkaliphilus]|uniref:Uncharacterized protein n=1 Tax=Streptomyces alkaliphilus TaxID=1472722 RepID=A0A7W3TE86_9ACTN|nr:hypothetical protein [Streptomyces alkaliphilus]MBB0245226.1 hypothetical protein [Streptomyces alkaliphilus]